MGVRLTNDLIPPLSLFSPAAPNPSPSAHVLQSTGQGAPRAGAVYTDVQVPLPLGTMECDGARAFGRPFCCGANPVLKVAVTPPSRLDG